MTGGPAFVRAELLSRTFMVGAGLFDPGKPLLAVKQVSLDIARGTTLGLVGESGSGKSTVGRLLLGLDVPTSGKVFLGDTEVTGTTGEAWRALRRRMQLVFQDPSAALNPRLCVRDAVKEPLDIHRPGLPPRERRAKAEALLARVGLSPELGQRLPGELSGGQRQRVVIARALAVEPEFVVADEPVSALDVSVQAQVVNLLRDLQAERGLTYLFISHDLRVVEHVADEVAVMYLGKLVERAPTRALFSAPIHPYTKALLSAVPDPRPGRARERIVLEGEPPSPLYPPRGCYFHPRCPKVRSLDYGGQAKCRTQPPILRVLGDRSVACHHEAVEAVPPAG
jgi:oligopeptide/dipeptide ABC transporter ATP-binding protein